MNYKLAIVGKPSSVLIYKTIGCEAHACFDAKEAQAQAESLFRADQGDDAGTSTYAVVFVEEAFFKTFPEDLLEKFTKKALPAMIPVPSPGSEDSDFASERLRSIVERAVGSDILG